LFGVGKGQFLGFFLLLLLNLSELDFLKFEIGFSFKVHDELGAIKGLVLGSSPEFTGEFHLHL
jgi:hypothetical protein